MIKVAGKADFWQLQTTEAYRRTPPDLVGLETLAGPGLQDRLHRLDELDINTGVDLQSGRSVGPEIDRIRQSRPGDFAAAAVSSNLEVTTAAPGSLTDAARKVWARWVSARGAGGPYFPDASVQVVKVDRALQFRSTLPRILLRAESDPSLYSMAPANAGQPVEQFASARGLLLGLFFLDPYLAPVLVGNAPYVWAFSAPRAGVQVIFSLGTFAKGTLGEPAEVLQMFGPQGVTTMPPRPQVSSSELSAALQWWTQHVNMLLGVVSDPVLFARADRRTYSPQGQMQTLLSLEQLFRHVQSILTQVRDKHARRLALFGFLDTLPSLVGKDFVSACTFSVAKKTLDNLKAAIDPVAARLLIPPAERAVAALKQLQQGFVLRTDVTAGTVRLPDKKGVLMDQPIERATAAYLFVLRNATHGFGGKDDNSRRRNEALLASHSGEVPDDLPMLAYLYLLALVSDSSGLTLRLRSQISP